MGYTFSRRILAPIPALALWFSPGVAAAVHIQGLEGPASDLAVATAEPAEPVLTAGLDQLPDVDVLSTEGATVEAILGEVGLGAAWRATIGLDPIARAMTVDYEGGGESIADLLSTTIAWQATTEAHTEAVHELRQAALDLNRARTVERDRQIDRNVADVYFRGTHALMQSVAIDLFSGGDPESEALLGLDGAALTSAQRTQELTDHTLEEMLERRRQAEADLHAAIAAHEAAIDRRESLEANHAERQTEANRLARSRRELEQSARETLPAAAEDFALAAVPREPGFTPRALHAYIRAEQVMAELAPRCRISWQTVAAVGAVEGKHGSHGDRRLGMEGLSDEPIVGIPLDGIRTDNFGEVVASIPDTDGGRYDGDPVHDRAIGPMQFIPQTWERWGIDADENGEDDPHDIDDAAVSAAAYLCNYGSLRTWDTWNTAVFGYNHSAAYVTSVKTSLDRVALIRLPDIDAVDDLEIPRPWGEWTALPEPEPEPGEETEEVSAEAG